MSETHLRELLSDVAEQADHVDLLPVVRARLRRRRQRRGAAAVLGAAVAVSAVAYGATQFTGGHVAQPDKPIVSPSPSNPRQSTTSVIPQYLPRGATLIRTGPIEPLPGQDPTSPDHPTMASSYHLAGAANANTNPDRPLTESEARDPHYHPATTLEISFVPRQAFLGELNGSQARALRRVLPPAQTRFGFTRQPVTVGGNHALVTLDHKVGGAFRVDWIDSAGYHSVSCDRIITADGVSGLRQAVLIRVARSLYST